MEPSLCRRLGGGWGAFQWRCIVFNSSSNNLLAKICIPEVWSAKGLLKVKKPIPLLSWIYIISKQRYLHIWLKEWGVAPGVFHELPKEKYIPVLSYTQPRPTSHTDRKQMHELVTTGLHSPSHAPFSPFPHFLPSDQFVKSSSFTLPQTARKVLFPFWQMGKPRQKEWLKKGPWGLVNSARHPSRAFQSHFSAEHKNGCSFSSPHN